MSHEVICAAASFTTTYANRSNQTITLPVILVRTMVVDIVLRIRSIRFRNLSKGELPSIIIDEVKGCDNTIIAESRLQAFKNVECREVWVLQRQQQSSLSLSRYKKYFELTKCSRCLSNASCMTIAKKYSAGACRFFYPRVAVALTVSTTLLNAKGSLAAISANTLRLS